MEKELDITQGLVADLHIHSKYSRATSKNLSLENLEKYARIKGVNLLGTGDFQHPEWSKELDTLEERQGILYTKTGFPFVWQTEISLMYSQDGKGRRIHFVILAPSREVSKQITSFLSSKGRLDYDGRPIFGFSAIELVDAMARIDDKIEIIPAHAWTPYFGIFGSMSGFDSLKECFQDRVDSIHAIETGMSCYDPLTEVLTNNGWKKISDVKEEDEICTLNLNKDTIEFQKPIKIFKYKHQGKMYRLKTKRVDLLVTPNHKLLISKCDFRKPAKFFLKEAELLFNKSKRFKKDGSWIGRDIEYFKLPEVKIKHGSKFYSGTRSKNEEKFLMMKWLKFFGYWVADGWTTKGDGGNYGTYLASKDEKVISEMRKILEEFRYHVYQYKNKGLETLRVRDFQLFSYLKQFGKAAEKFIPQEIKSLNKELLEIFFEYYIRGDGHRYGRTGKGLSATTISKRLRDDLQEIALKLGMSAYYKLHRKKGSQITSLPKADLKGYKQSEDSWNIYFIRKNIHTVMPSTLKKWGYEESWGEYDGLVYCLEVPNHIIYIRRNGIPVWCGNSDPEMNWHLSELNNKSIVSFSDLHSFWPWRIARESTIFKKQEGKELDYQELARQIRENDFLGTIETNPSYGKYHYDGHRNCNFSCSPAETLKLKGMCPVCGKLLTLGVEYRVNQLTNQQTDQYPRKKPFFKLLPLHELISFSIGSPLASKKTWEIYNKMTAKLGDEFKILIESSKEQLIEFGNLLAELILKNRQGNLKVKPGYDGTYGEIIADGKVFRIENDNIQKGKSQEHEHDKLFFNKAFVQKKLL